MSKPYKSLLLVYYHPVVFDLALSFSKLFDRVDICVTPGLKDNYGDHNDVVSKAKSLGFDAFLTPVALMNIKSKKYDLIGLDGVFQGDKTIMDVCLGKIPHFCINGYPHNMDEPSANILSFSWYLPEKQYRQSYPSEAHVKQIDWENISTKGRSDGKNICTFYPEFSELKRWGSIRYKVRRDEFVSFIHRFEECNKHSYSVFEQVGQKVVLKNYSSLNQEAVWDKILSSYGLIHLKHGDCPGIALLESMMLGRTPIVMKSFVLASQNQEVLIDAHSAYVCDTVDEMIDRSLRLMDAVDFTYRDGQFDNLTDIEKSTKRHALMLTDFNRQIPKLLTFFNRCLS